MDKSICFVLALMATGCQSQDIAQARATTLASTAPAGACEHPYPCAGDWPKGLQGPFALESVEHVFIPMSDGVELEAWIGMPDLPDGVAAPVILNMQPYIHTCSATSLVCWSGPDHPAWWTDDPNTTPVSGQALYQPILELGMPAIRYIEQGYAVVHVALRGTAHSGGCLEDGSPRQLLDSSEAVQWLAEQAWSNGRVAMLGLSYSAQSAMQALVAAPQALKASIITGIFTDFYTYGGTPQGAMFWLNGPAGEARYNQYSLFPDIFNADRTAGTAMVTPDRGCPESTDMTLAYTLVSYQDNRDAAFWSGSRNMMARMNEVTAAVLSLHGFVDVHGHRWQEDLLWEGLAHAPKQMAEGQWAHTWPTASAYARAQAGDGALAGAFYLPPDPPPWWDAGFEELMLDWLAYWLKGVGPRPPGLGKVDYQDSAGVWRRSTSWPPREAREEALFLAGTSLARQGEAGSRSYTTLDNPVDYLGVTPDELADIADFDSPDAGIWAALCPDAPQRVVDTALAWITPALDEAVTVAGNPFALLQLSSDQPYGIVALDLVDLGPEFVCDASGRATGYEVLNHELADGAADLNFYQGNFLSIPFPVDQPQQVRIDFPSLATRLEAGHRLALVASVGFGRVGQNTSDFVEPTLTIHAAADVNASRLILPVVAGSFGVGLNRGEVPPRPFGP